MENSLAAFEEEAERNLVTMCQEKKQLLKKAHELKRKLLLCQKKRELVDVLNPQIEMLSPYAAVSESFKEQYKALAKALDTTRHELPVRSVHLDGGAQKFLGRTGICWARNGKNYQRVWHFLCAGTFIPSWHPHKPHVR
ncbi:HAUS augmin-like complex subunit 8 [Myotis brandtii]|uniref:HAUS augmin-like complex subunit 8 n=2 Tax=Myotis brandtii TaxID=109478 RepID=S7QGV0_MYOBR|nr:HAUS augmin-like complex subunit 8 [Myotis brandtii]